MLRLVQADTVITSGCTVNPPSHRVGPAIVFRSHPDSLMTPSVGRLALPAAKTMTQPLPRRPIVAARVTAFFCRSESGKYTALGPQLQEITAAPRATHQSNSSSMESSSRYPVVRIGINEQPGATPTPPLPFSSATATPAQAVPWFSSASSGSGRKSLPLKSRGDTILPIP